MLSIGIKYSSWKVVKAAFFSNVLALWQQCCFDHVRLQALQNEKEVKSMTKHT